MKFNSVKWKLMLTTLPITAVIVLIKLGITHGLHYDGLVKFSEIGIVITGGIFLIGFMLAGTISDYKESEKIPAEMACTIETIEDMIALGHEVKGGFDLSAARKQLNDVTESIIAWFEHRVNDHDVFERINSLTSIATVLENAGVGPIGSRMGSEQHNLRKLFTRSIVIEKTSFLAPGYALLEVLTVVIIALLLLARFENETTSIIIISFLSQIFIYMIRLILDEDDPFEYTRSGKVKEADIDLFPLMQYDRRAKKRI